MEGPTKVQWEASLGKERGFFNMKIKFLENIHK